jgi:hypothetical protein
MGTTYVFFHDHDHKFKQESDVISTFPSMPERQKGESCEMADSSHSQELESLVDVVGAPLIRGHVERTNDFGESARSFILPEVHVTDRPKRLLVRLIS